MAPKPAYDISTLLQSDPVLQAAMGNANTEGQRAQIALDQARQRALIGYGAVPDNPQIGQLAGDVTPETRGLAEQNTQAGLSTLAQLLRGYQRQQAGDVASLAGRGILRSGGLRQHSLENLQTLQTGQAGAASSLLDQLAGQWQNYGQTQQQLAGNVNTATGEALTRALQQIQNGVIATPTLAPAPSTTPRVYPGGAPTATAQPLPATRPQRKRFAAGLPGQKPLL